MTESTSAAEGVAISDPAYQAAVVALLGLISCAELAAFERLAEDAKLAPGLPDRIALVTMAAVEVDNLLKLRDRLASLGVDPHEAMARFEPALEAFHRHTSPSNWLEGLVKAYVG